MGPVPKILAAPRLSPEKYLPLQIALSPLYWILRDHVCRIFIGTAVGFIVEIQFKSIKINMRRIYIFFRGFILRHRQECFNFVASVKLNH